MKHNDICVFIDALPFAQNFRDWAILTI